MDPISMGFYAVICGTLSVAGPVLGGWMRRIGIGVVVGAGAALVLPVLKAAMGSGY